MKRHLLLAVLAAYILTGCTKDLESKIAQLEETISMMQSDHYVLQRTIDMGLSVSKFNTLAGGYELEMSDASRIYLYEDEDPERKNGIVFSSLEIADEGKRLIVTVDDDIVYELPILIVEEEEKGEEETEPDDDGPWGGYLDPDVYDAQDIINLTNVLRANMSTHNLATTHIMEIAYNFWKRRGEFIYCADTALDKPWNYWSYVGFKDGNTGFTVGEGHGGYKRIDCSTFVRYVVNGIDYYSTPYYNALEWTEVTQGALSSSGANATSSDAKVCRTGKMYLRSGKKYILEKASSSYSFTKVFAYDSSGKMIQNLSGVSSFVTGANVAYIKAEMKVASASNYAPAVKGVSPAAILKCLRIREDERLAVNAEIPLSGLRSTFQICPWLDEQGFGLEAYKDYNPLAWEDSDFLPGTIMFMGQNNNSRYKGITHIVLYIGGGYIIHSQGARGLLGGEGIMIDSLRDMEYRYTRPLCSAAVVKYHTDYSEEKGLLGL